MTGALANAERDLGLWELIRRDFARYCHAGTPLSLFARVRIYLDNPGFHAVLTYRYGNWVIRRVRARLLYYPLQLVHYILQKLCFVIAHVHIDPGATIGPGLYVGHFGNVIIGPVTMGADCNVGHQVTIGMRADGRSQEKPVIGDNVWFGAGCVVYGEITVGNGVMIGPNTVVARSLPDRTMVLGNPMKVISSDYDNYLSIYGHPRPSTPADGRRPPNSAVG